MEKEKNCAVIKNNFVQNKRTCCLKVLSSQKILFEKVTNVATRKEKPYEFESNIFVNTIIVWIPKENVRYPPKNCCSYSLDFHNEAVHLHCQPRKALFHGGTY